MEGGWREAAEGVGGRRAGRRVGGREGGRVGKRGRGGGVRPASPANNVTGRSRAYVPARAREQAPASIPRPVLSGEVLAHKRTQRTHAHARTEAQARKRARAHAHAHPTHARAH